MASLDFVPQNDSQSFLTHLIEPNYFRNLGTIPSPLPLLPLFPSPILSLPHLYCLIYAWDLNYSITPI